MLCLGAANRDPRKFEDPHVFRPDRKSVREHIAFGRGIHTLRGCTAGAGRSADHRQKAAGPDVRQSELILLCTCAIRARNYFYEPTFLLRGLTDAAYRVHPRRRLIARIAATGLLAYATLGTSMAHADEFGAVNGVFNAVSNGDRARTNNVYMDEQTVVSTWTISITCTMYQICEGIVQQRPELDGNYFLQMACGTSAGRFPTGSTALVGGTATWAAAVRFYPVNVAKRSDGARVRTSSPESTGPRRMAGPAVPTPPTVIEMPFRLSRAS